MNDEVQSQIDALALQLEAEGFPVIRHPDGSIEVQIIEIEVDEGRNG